jgi:hypothetical protein
MSGMFNINNLARESWLDQLVGLRIVAVTSDPGCVCVVLLDEDDKAHLLTMALDNPHELAVRLITLSEALKKEATQKLKPRRNKVVPFAKVS